MNGKIIMDKLYRLKHDFDEESKKWQSACESPNEDSKDGYKSLGRYEGKRDSFLEAKEGLIKS